MVVRGGALGQDVKFIDQLIGKVFHRLVLCVLQAGIDQSHAQRLVVQNSLNGRRQTARITRFDQQAIFAVTQR
jgi:hypothetical protein